MPLSRLREGAREGAGAHALTAYLLVAAVGFAGLATMGVPMLRLRLRTGGSGVVFHRSRSAAQRAVGAVLGVLFAGELAWAIAVAAAGPERLGIWPRPAAIAGAGWALFAAGLGLTVLAQAQMGTAWRMGIDEGRTRLVTDGLFRWCRNPIYAGLLALFLGVVAITPAPISIAHWLAIAAAIAVLVRLEERHLRALHGEDYLAYAARVGRFCPWLGRLEPRRGPG